MNDNVNETIFQNALHQLASNQSIMNSIFQFDFHTNDISNVMRV